MCGGIVVPRNIDREEFAERKRLGAEYLFQIARTTGEKRQELIVEWAEKLYDARAQRRTGLVKSWSDVSLLRTELFLFQSGTVMPLLAAAHPDDFEIQAIRLALEGRESNWLADIVQRFPAESAAEENSGPPAASGAPVVSEDLIAAQRRARVDEYIDGVFRCKRKHIFRSDIWRAAGYGDATAFERWQRNDRRTSKQHDKSFSRILAEKPHLK